VLYWGADCRVLEPEELKNEVRRQAEAISQHMEETK